MRPYHKTVLVRSLDVSVRHYNALLPLLSFAKDKEHKLDLR